MPSTYTLNNGIELIGTGEQSGTWGDTTNTNLGLLDAALDGQVTITLGAAGSSGSPNSLPITDGTASNGRNRMVVFADGGDLGATAYVQLTPNDAEKIIYIRNSLSGSRSVILFQGTYNASNDYEVPAGTTAVVYFDGAGAGAVAANVFNNAYFDGLRLGSVSVTAILDEDNMASDSAAALATQQSIKAYVDSQVGTVDTLAEILAIGNTTGATDIAVDSAQKVQFRDAAIYINSSVDGQLDIVADTEIQIAATTIDVNGALDVSGTALVTGVLTTTAATVSNGGGQFNGAINVGVDDTGYDVKFFGATTGKSLLWDESADSLIVTGTTTLVGTTNLDAVDIDGATQIDATVTVGVDDTGYDVKFFGATAGAYMLWDESADDLILGGAAGLSVNSTALVTGVLTTTAATVFNGGFASNANSTVGGTLGVTGVVTANAGVVVDNFTLDGTTLALSSGSMTLDSASQIVLDAAGGNFQFSKSGTEFGRIFESGSDFYIYNPIDDKDIKFYGLDGGVSFTALTIDMSAAGAATFNNKVTAIQYNISSVGNDDRQIGVDGGGFFVYNTADSRYDLQINDVGAVSIGGVVTANAGVVVDNITIDGQEIDVSSGDLTLDVAGDIILDADTGVWRFKDAGTTLYQIAVDGASVVLYTGVSDADMVFKGNDGGSTVTALTLDMSDAGSATFNHDIFLPDAGRLYFTSTSGYSPRISNDITTTTMSFFTNNTERMYIVSGGDVTVKTGNLVIGTAGKGIDFSAQTGTATGTTNVEVLDHYETGSWTPTFNATDMVPGTGVGETNITYSVRSGRYTRIGDSVHITGNIITSGRSGTERAALTVDGLPFTCGTPASHSMSVSFAYNFTDNATAPLAATAQSANAHLLLYTNQTSNAQCNTSDIVASGSSYFNFAGTYLVG
jgi:hypothetical protein